MQFGASKFGVQILATWMSRRDWIQNEVQGSYWFGGLVEPGYLYARAAGLELSLVWGRNPDPVVRRLENAPLDDEPLTPEEESANEEARREIDKHLGDVTVTPEDEAAILLEWMKIETELETNGRWIADIPAIPGAMAYGETETAAIFRARAIATTELVRRIRVRDAMDRAARDNFDLLRLLSKH